MNCKDFGHIEFECFRLQEEGKLHLLKTRWWKERRGGGSCRVCIHSFTSQWRSVNHNYHNLFRMKQAKRAQRQMSSD